jgi:hypothetical protein
MRVDAGSHLSSLVLSSVSHFPFFRGFEQVFYPKETIMSASISASTRSARPDGPAPAKAEPVILFQNYFKSVGPRTYAAQVKKAGNGNHFLVITEGKRDEASAQVKKTKLFVFSEDFPAFFRMLHETAQFIKANPVSDDVKRKREKFWAKKHQPGASPAK